MSIANELSSDVGAAVLSLQENETSISKKEIVEIILAVHSTLRELTVEAQREDRHSCSSSQLASRVKSAKSNG